MSDLFELRQKVEEGAEWRGTINVAMDDEVYELSVRHLRDPENWEVLSLIDTDEIEEFQEKLPEETMEQIQELRDKDDLSEEEEAKLEALQEEIEEADVNMFDILSTETFEGIRKAAIYGVEPDQQDLSRILTQYGGEVKEKYGKATDEEARRWYNENELPDFIDRCTNFVSFAIGIQALGETLGDTGN